VRSRSQSLFAHSPPGPILRPVSLLLQLRCSLSSSLILFSSSIPCAPLFYSWMPPFPIPMLCHNHTQQVKEKGKVRVAHEEHKRGKKGERILILFLNQQGREGGFCLFLSSSVLVLSLTLIQSPLNLDEEQLIRTKRGKLSLILSSLPLMCCIKRGRE